MVIDSKRPTNGGSMPVDVIIAPRCWRQASMGDRHSGGICRSTPKDTWASRVLIDWLIDWPHYVIILIMSLKSIFRQTLLWHAAESAYWDCFVRRLFVSRFSRKANTLRSPNEPPKFNIEIVCLVGLATGRKLPKKRIIKHKFQQIAVLFCTFYAMSPCTLTFSQNVILNLTN